MFVSLNFRCNPVSEKEKESFFPTPESETHRPHSRSYFYNRFKENTHTNQIKVFSVKSPTAQGLVYSPGVRKARDFPPRLLFTLDPSPKSQVRDLPLTPAKMLRDTRYYSQNWNRAQLYARLGCNGGKIRKSGENSTLVTHSKREIPNVLMILQRGIRKP